MRLSTLRFSGLLLAALAATPALADAPAAPAAPEPTPEFTFNASATVVSDYRFRGISQTDKNFAVQGSLTVTHKSGFYASVWGSSVDDYVTVSGQGHQEIDIIAGYKKTIGSTTIDGGVLYYFYPKTKLAGDKSSSDFFEPYISVAQTYGPVTGKVTVNFAPKQKALALNQISPAKSNFYLAGDLSASIPKTPIGLTAHLGHTFGPSWLATDFNNKKGYTDWGVGATYTYKQFTIGVQYVDTDALFVSGTGKNVSKGGVVGSVGVSF
jgi:uncharacterized protein (TIGR02001 family)